MIHHDGAGALGDATDSVQGVTHNHIIIASQDIGSTKGQSRCSRSIGPEKILAVAVGDHSTGTVDRSVLSCSEPDSAASIDLGEINGASISTHINQNGAVVKSARKCQRCRNACGSVIDRDSSQTRLLIDQFDVARDLREAVDRESSAGIDQNIPRRGKCRCRECQLQFSTIEDIGAA